MCMWKSQESREKSKEKVLSIQLRKMNKYNTNVRSKGPMYSFELYATSCTIRRL